MVVFMETVISMQPGRIIRTMQFCTKCQPVQKRGCTARPHAREPVCVRVCVTAMRNNAIAACGEISNRTNLLRVRGISSRITVRRSIKRGVTIELCDAIELLRVL